MYHLYCFEYGNAWSRLEQGKKLQHFLLDRVAKFTSLCLEQGQRFNESAEPLYPNPVDKTVIVIFTCARFIFELNSQVLDITWSEILNILFRVSRIRVLSVPSLLFAIHWYHPQSSSVIFLISRTLSLKSGLCVVLTLKKPLFSPSFIFLVELLKTVHCQENMGSGLPRAAHFSLASSPTLA